MGKVLTWCGGVSIGAYQFPDRKRPCLCVGKGNQIVVYGTFQNEQSADRFMDELGKLVGAVEKEG